MAAAGKPKETNGSDAPAPLRRVPTQERSRARLARILDAAEQLFAKVGFASTTMEEIAAEAGTSIGSVYQFFPNKPALFSALQARYLERSRELFESVVGMVQGATDWRQLLSQMVDTFWHLYCDVPGFRAVWASGTISAEVLAQNDSVNREIAHRVADIMAHFAPDVAVARRRAAASVVVETVSALLFVAARREPAEAQVMVEETKRLCEAYLESVLAASGAEPNPA